MHIRNHKDGSVGHYYKSLGMMYLTDDVDIMINMVPFDNMDVKDDKEYNQKIKSEGEITVFKKIIPQLEEYKIDICVLDCMFLNGPCLNAAKSGIPSAVKWLKEMNLSETEPTVQTDSNITHKHVN